MNNRNQQNNPQFGLFGAKTPLTKTEINLLQWLRDLWISKGDYPIEEIYEALAKRHPGFTPEEIEQMLIVNGPTSASVNSCSK